MSVVINIHNQPFPSAHRRLRAVILDIPFYKKQFIEGHIVHEHCVEGLPEGAKYIGAQLDIMALSVYLIFEHESFEPLKNGQEIPLQPVRYESVPDAGQVSE